MLKVQRPRDLRGCPRQICDSTGRRERPHDVRGSIAKARRRQGGAGAWKDVAGLKGLHRKHVSIQSENKQKTLNDKFADHSLGWLRAALQFATASLRYQVGGVGMSKLCDWGSGFHGESAMLRRATLFLLIAPLMLM